MVAATDKYSGLSAVQVRELLAYDPETGLLTWKVEGRGTSQGRVAGSMRNNGYFRVGIRRKAYSIHRIAWLIYYGEWPKDQVDHIDGDRTNNRISNLRPASATVNSQNRVRAQANNRLGVMGVRLYRGKYQACLRLSGKYVYLGRYCTIEEARDAYLKAKRELHEGNTL